MEKKDRLWRFTPLVVIAAAAAVIAVTAFDVRVATLAWLAVASICPLMMLFMHRPGQDDQGHSGGCHGEKDHEGHDAQEKERR